MEWFISLIMNLKITWCSTGCRPRNRSSYEIFVRTKKKEKKVFSREKKIPEVLVHLRHEFGWRNPHFHLTDGRKKTFYTKCHFFPIFSTFDLKVLLSSLKTRQCLNDDRMTGKICFNWKFLFNIVWYYTENNINKINTRRNQVKLPAAVWCCSVED